MNEGGRDERGEGRRKIDSGGSKGGGGRRERGGRDVGKERK